MLWPAKNMDYMITEQEKTSSQVGFEKKHFKNERSILTDNTSHPKDIDLH